MRRVGWRPFGCYRTTREGVLMSPTALNLENWIAGAAQTKGERNCGSFQITSTKRSKRWAVMRWHHCRKSIAASSRCRCTHRNGIYHTRSKSPISSDLRSTNCWRSIRGEIPRSQAGCNGRSNPHGSPHRHGLNQSSCTVAWKVTPPDLGGSRSRKWPPR